MKHYPGSIYTCTFILYLTFFSYFTGYSNQRSDESSRTLPFAGERDSSLKISPESIASGILLNSPEPETRLMDIYTWVGKNIVYDPGQIDNPEPYKSTEDLIQQVLTKKKAICQGYAALFNELCKLCSIQSYIIHGYIKHDGMVDNLPHAWIAARLNGSWFLFDPTWSAGGVENRTFVPRFTFDFYKIAPNVSIQSRMPFDPSWQLLPHPFSPGEFLSGKQSESNTVEYNFNDSIDVFLQATEHERFLIESRRVLQGGLANKLISDYNTYLLNAIDVIRSNKEVEKNNEIVTRSNMAVENFNEAINAFNLYVNAKNNQFGKPKYTDEQVKELILKPDNLLLKSELIVRNLAPDDATLKKNIGELSRNIAELRKTIKQEKIFVDNYCLTPQAKRMMLFRAPANRKKSHK
jgi:hypothetical protein